MATPLSPAAAAWTGRRAALALGVSALLAGCGKVRPKTQRVPAGAPVLALGDSLTFGTGADASSAYPAVLAELTGWDVINAGVPGATAEQALQRLPALLQEHTPQLVLVGIGGNDLLRRMPEASTQATVRRICEESATAGAQVLLIGVPRPSVAARLTGSLSDHPMYKTIAAELKIALHAGGWSAVLSDASLRSDEIHANAAGYRHFAQGLQATARAVGLL